MDDDQKLYAEDTVLRLAKLFQSIFGEYFKTYWQATPTEMPPGPDWPLIIVQKLEGKAVLGPTSTDDATETIMVSVMLNRADDVGSGNMRTTTMRHLQNLVEGQDPITRNYKEDTIFYAVRTFLTLMDGANDIPWLIDSDVSVKYSQADHGDLSIAVADITISTIRRVIVPGRN